MKFNDRFDKKITLQDYELPRSLHTFVQSTEQVESLLEIMQELKDDAGYIQFVKDAKDDQRNILQNENTKNQQIEDLIAYYIEHECYEGAEHLRRALALAPQPSVEISLTPSVQKKMLKQSLEQTLKDAGFKRIPKLITEINKLLS